VAEHAIEFEDQHDTIGRLRCTGETMLYEGQPLFLKPAAAPDVPLERTVAPIAEPSQRSTEAARLSQKSMPRLPRRKF